MQPRSELLPPFGLSLSKPGHRIIKNHSCQRLIYLVCRPFCIQATTTVKSEPVEARACAMQALRQVQGERDVCLNHPTTDSHERC